MADEKNLIYPELPEDLKAVSDDDLTQLHEKLTVVVTKATDRDPELLKGLTQAQALDQTRAAVDGLKAVNAEREARVELEKNFEDELAKLRAEANVPVEAVAETGGEGDSDDTEGDGEGEGGDAEPEAEPEAEAAAGSDEVVAEDGTAVVEDAELVPVAASTIAPAGKAARPRPAQAKGKHVPNLPVATQGAPLTAAGNLPHFPMGTEFDMESLAKAICKLNDHANGGGDLIIASADRSDLWPKERTLGFNGEQMVDLMKAIGAVTSDEALTASGGLCAPVTPYYQLQNVSVAARPVRDSLAGFLATRGGLQFAAPAKISAVTGVGIKTAAQDAAGGTNAAKTCQVVPCPAFSTVNLEMIYRCLQFGNLNARSFPELIQQWTELSMADHARVADGALLTYIDGQSVATTSGPIYGTASTLITAISYAASGIRSRNRMDPDAVLRLLLPAWSRDAFATDVANSQFDRFGVERGDVEGLLRARGVAVTWYIDEATGAGQIIGTQSAGALVTFPNNIVGYLFPEGSYLFLDGGTLDLGIVRDSTLNSTNDFQIFMETFEAAAFVGVESLKLTMTACENGTVANPATAFSC